MRIARRTLPLALALLAGCAGGTHPASRPAIVATDDVPLGTLPRQALAPGQCGLFLWKAGAARLVLMAKSGPPPFARILLDGRSLDLPRIGDAAGDFTSDARARYGDGRVTVSLDLALEQRQGLSDGAIAGGSISLERVGGEGFVVPVSGLLACA